MNKTRIGIMLSWTAVLLWMLLIFNFSSQVADQSDKLSSGIVVIIAEFLENIGPGYDVDVAVFDGIVRKAAHFAIYLILGILVSDALGRSGAESLKLLVLALGICMLYAVSDEVHQLFVPGRSGQAADVLIDSAGAVLGIGMRMLMGWGRK